MYVAFEQLNGAAPFGEGLETWFKNSPMFNLERIHTPVLQFMLGPYSYRNMWESYTALRRLHKPVEMIYLPDSNHWPIRPSERISVQQRSVDWFRYWLKGEKDSSRNKDERYRGWDELRKIAIHDAASASTTP